MDTKNTSKWTVKRLSIVIINLSFFKEPPIQATLVAPLCPKKEVDLIVSVTKIGNKIYKE